MLLESLDMQQPLVVLILGITTILFYHLYRTYSQLQHIPGPLIAKFTNFYRFFLARHGRLHLHQDRAHQRYGPAVRFGPNVVCICDPEAIQTIFNLRGGFSKVCRPNLYATESLHVDGC